MERDPDGVKNFAQWFATLATRAQGVIAKGLVNIKSVGARRAAIGIGRHGGRSPLDGGGAKVDNSGGGDNAIDCLIVMLPGDIVDHFVVIDHSKHRGAAAECA